MDKLVFMKAQFQFTLDVAYLGDQTSREDYVIERDQVAEDLADKLGATFMYAETTE